MITSEIFNEREDNPFQTLYLTEALEEDPQLHWDLFSPEIVRGEAQRLFRGGNVVLLGSNGTGKTMLLRLFSPEVQAVYLRNNVRLPIPVSDQRMLSVGVNFTTAGFGALGKKKVSLADSDSLGLWPLLMADYMNYFLVNELLKTLRFLSTDKGKPLAKFWNAKIDKVRINEFAHWLSTRECWFGALKSATTFDKLSNAIKKRIYTYRSFVNWNIDSLPDTITKTKTEIGAPLVQCRDALDACGILSHSIPFVVTIDQYETLFHIDYETEPRQEKSIGCAFCRVVNSFLATRNPKVSYKIGVRPYSWDYELRAFGTDARLEVGRDYQVVDLDAVLRRREDTKSWIFPSFASDVAGRRIAYAYKQKPEKYRDWLKNNLETLPSEKELEKYCRSHPKRLLPRDAKWPRAWNHLLEKLYGTSKFQAKLAQAWINQTLGANRKLPEKPPITRQEMPWNRTWWQKERREALLMQIASECRQRRLYGGWDTILTLSGSNILVFLSLVRETWDIAARAQSKLATPLEKISPEIQSQAIRLVSESWLKKQDEFPGGAQRRDFVTRLGIGIRKAILADRGLVYPGHNGFSLPLDEYNKNEASDLQYFLENATDFGALISSPHTTKEKNRRLRKKWYIFPILCPNFEIPAIRTKEPYYATLPEVKSWLRQRQAIVFRRPGERQLQNQQKSSGTPVQPDLFGDHDFNPAAEK